MHCALPRHHDAVSTQGDLGDDVRSVVVFRAHRGDLFLERQLLGDRLQRGEGDGQACLAAELAHPAEFVPLAHHVARHLEHAMAGAAHRAADLDEFLGGGGGAGDDFAVDGAVEHGAGGGEPQRAGADPFLDDLAHRGDVFRRRDGTRALAFAEHVRAHRAVGHVGADVDRPREFLERVEVVREGLPIPLHPLGERGAGDVLHPLHQPD